METKDIKIGFISLGCDKNRVDLEKIIYDIKTAGFTIENDENLANVIIINTCSFIESSRKESIDTILGISKLKNKNLEHIIVTGCLNEMGYTDLETSLPEVDKFIRVSNNKNIVAVICDLYKISLPKIDDICFKGTLQRTITTPKHFAYLKIADGCNNFCSYCKIPYIRGRFKSEKQSDLINEANNLVQNGTREIILVAQDVTKYGSDLNDGSNLVTLIRELSKIGNLLKIRLLYCYPENVTDELIAEIKTNSKVCKYLDIPLQHVSDSILKAMNRKCTQKDIISLIDKLKKEIPGLVIRSTFIIGFPNETDDNFNELCSFIKQYNLYNIGFFEYSKEDGTVASKLKNQISAKIKHSRMIIINKIQYDLTMSEHKKLIGSVFPVIVDEISDGLAICRTEFQTPFVDPIVYVEDDELSVGNIIKIKITDLIDYDFKGEKYDK